MEAYKFVDLAVAEHVAAGKLKIGTLKDYASLESERRDIGEGTTKQYIENEVFDGSTANPQGVHVSGNGTVTMEGSTFVLHHPNVHTFCMSSTIKAMPNTPQAIFLIRQPQRLAMLLSALNRQLGSYSIAQKVRYASRTRNWKEEAIVSPSPAVKSREFAWESEIRIWWPFPKRAPVVWDPTMEELLDFHAYHGSWKERMRGSGIAGFITPASAEIASLLDRIG